MSPEAKLARRYRDLLEVYPAHYRARRGEELLATLLEVARPGQRWPSWWEARALLLEGLRMRAGTARYTPVRQTLVSGLQVTVLVLIAMSVSRGTVRVVRLAADVDLPAWWLPGLAAGVVAGIVPFVLVAVGRVRAALPFVVFLGVAATLGYPLLIYYADLTPDMPGPHISFGLVHGDLVLSLLAVLATAAMWPSRPGRAGPAIVAGVLLLPGFEVLASLLARLDVGDLLDGLDLTLFLMYCAMYVGVIGYAAVDARPAIAMTAYMTAVFVDFVSAGLLYDIGGLAEAATVLVPPTLLVGLAAWTGTRRLARIPSTGHHGASTPS